MTEVTKDKNGKCSEKLVAKRIFDVLIHCPVGAFQLPVIAPRYPAAHLYKRIRSLRLSWYHGPE